MEKMMILLEEIDSVVGVEIGLAQEMNVQMVASIVESAVGELPLMIRVPISKAERIGRAAYQAGASLISIGPPRGALTAPTGEKIFGRLYGPSIFPQALEAVSSLVSLKIPVVGGGGVYHPDQVKMMLEAGATAVQLDAVLWRGGFFE
jgi:dihydroorotate dehydrogenase (NAD+) catalytic subunit